MRHLRLLNGWISSNSERGNALVSTNYSSSLLLPSESIYPVQNEVYNNSFECFFSHDFNHMEDSKQNTEIVFQFEHDAINFLVTRVLQAPLYLQGFGWKCREFERLKYFNRRRSNNKIRLQWISLPCVCWDVEISHTAIFNFSNVEVCEHESYKLW